MLSRACSVIQPVSIAGLKGAQGPGPIPTPPRVFDEHSSVPSSMLVLWGRQEKLKNTLAFEELAVCLRKKNLYKKWFVIFSWIVLLLPYTTSFHSHNPSMCVLLSPFHRQENEALRG